MLEGARGARASGLRAQRAGGGLADRRDHGAINYSEGRSELQRRGAGGGGEGTVPSEHICFIISRSIILS